MTGVVIETPKHRFGARRQTDAGQRIWKVWETNRDRSIEVQRAVRLDGDDKRKSQARRQRFRVDKGIRNVREGSHYSLTPNHRLGSRYDETKF